MKDWAIYPSYCGHYRILYFYISCKLVYWIVHILRRDSLRLDIIKGQMKGRATRGRRRLQMLHMLAKDGYVAMK